MELAVARVRLVGRNVAPPIPGRLERRHRAHTGICLEYGKSIDKRSRTPAGPLRASVRSSTKRPRGTLIMSERLLRFLQYVL